MKDRAELFEACRQVDHNIGMVGLVIYLTSGLRADRQALIEHLCAGHPLTRPEARKVANDYLAARKAG
jgi:hypothetical protein